MMGALTAGPAVGSIHKIGALVQVRKSRREESARAAFGP
jgi:hypothetical protein